MNERIRELAVQARQEFLKLPTGYTPEQVGMYPQLMEKFAELIVRECAKRVESKADRWGNMTDEIINECILKCAKDLKEHFGVEE
jgi:hypothetical protein